MHKKLYAGGGGKDRRVFVLTGENRPPRRGEFFLSGAIPEVYQAFDDLETVYQIAREATTGEKFCECCLQRRPVER